MTTDDPHEPTPADDVTTDTPADAEIEPSDVVESDETDTTEGPAGKRRWGRGAGQVLTVLAALFVLFALVAPDELSSFSLAAFVRIPVEGLIGLAVLLVLPIGP